MNSQLQNRRNRKEMYRKMFNFIYNQEITKQKLGATFQPPDGQTSNIC